jgi:hypothetical protein
VVACPFLTPPHPQGGRRREHLIAAEHRRKPVDDAGHTAELPQRRGHGQRAVLGMAAAPTRRVEMRSVGRLGLAPGVEQQRIRIGQSEAARDERHGQQKGIESTQERVAHP